MEIKGACLCGTVRYVTTEKPVMAGNCHCRDCQKASGSAYAPTLFFPESGVRITGEVRYYRNTGDSGQAVDRGFCPVCGSQLFGKPAAMPGLLAIRAGSLEDTSQYQPQVDIFVASKAHWDFLPPEAVSFAQMPPKPSSA